MIIRRLAPDDLDGWLPLWHGYLKFYRADISEAITAATFERLAQSADGFVGLVAEPDGSGLVGFAHLLFHPSTWSATSYCYLEDFFVAPAARGTGAGQDILGAVFALADERGASRTYWATQEFNAPARSLYDQVGHCTSHIVYER